MELKIYDVRFKLSLKLIKKEIQASYEKDNPQIFQDFMYIPNLIIPFSIIFKKSKPLEIYLGNELIPFEEKDPKFKKILKNKFDNALKEFIKQMKQI